MARIRTIKPEFFTSEQIVGLTPLARLLFIALWCEADREGRMAWKPRTFKMRYFPGDTCDIDALARELIASRLVVLYGDELAYIPSFLKHQHINPRESASTLPDPVKSDASARVDDASAHVSDVQGGRKEGKEGKEGRKDEHPPAAAEVDPIALMIEAAVEYMTGTGVGEKQARSLIGMLRKNRGDVDAGLALAKLHAEKIADPAAWIAAAAKAKPKTTATGNPWDGAL